MPEFGFDIKQNGDSHIFSSSSETGDLLIDSGARVTAPVFNLGPNAGAMGLPSPTTALASLPSWAQPVAIGLAVSAIIWAGTKLIRYLRR